MIPEIGNLSLMLALCLALIQGIFPIAGSFRGTGSARSWLLSMARNAHRHQHRRRVDEPRAFVPLELLAQRAGWGADPAESRRADAALAHDLLTQALAHLPLDEREVLVLRELEGMSGPEAAAVLQLTEAAMKSRLHRAATCVTRCANAARPRSRRPAARLAPPGASGVARCHALVRMQINVYNYMRIHF